MCVSLLQQFWAPNNLCIHHWFFPISTQSGLGMMTPVRGLPGGAVVKNPPAYEGAIGDAGLSPGSDRSPGGGNGIHSSILAWKTAWTEKPDGIAKRWTRLSDWANTCKSAEHLFVLDSAPTAEDQTPFQLKQKKPCDLAGKPQHVPVETAKCTWRPIRMLPHFQKFSNRTLANQRQSWLFYLLLCKTHEFLWEGNRW